MSMTRQTKILATLGPASGEPETIMEMVTAGMDGARINAGHGEAGDWRALAAAVRRAADLTGRPIALVFDLSGPKIRLGADVLVREVVRGDEIIFASDANGSGAVEVGWPSLGVAVRPGWSEIVIGDGTPRFSVGGTDGRNVTATCVRPGVIGPRKGAFITHVTTTSPALTPKDLADLDVAVEIGADLVALSFVRGADDVRTLRAELQARGSRARVIAKIEKLEAYEHIDEIIAAADGVMVARGDLGVEVGAARVPLLQKDIIHRGTLAGKLVITATQMLESMIVAPEPTRAEASDVTNAILDGTSVLMLSGETAIGRYPVGTVEAMAEIAAEAQAAHPFALTIDAEPTTAAEAVVQSATHLAHQIGAAALVIPTSAGGSPRAAAKYRPNRPIIALAHDEVVANQLALEWGVRPGTLPPHPGRVEELIDEAIWSARVVGRLRNGDRVVVTYGQFGHESGGTDLIAVRVVGAATPPGWAESIDPAFG